MIAGECCNQNCNQGRACPRRPRAGERRNGATWLWRMLSRLHLARWLGIEKRRGWDRRARIATKPWGE